MSTVEVVEVPAGEDLMAALSGACAAGGVWVQGVGVIEGAELMAAPAVSEERRLVPGRVTLVSLSGPAGGPYGVVLASTAAGSLGTVAGLLRAARSAGVTLAVAGGPSLDAALAEVTRARSATERASSIPPPPVASGGPSGGWSVGGTGGRLRAASGAADEDEDDESDVMPEFKDRVIHPVFGLCDVMVVKGERLKIRDVEGPNRLREIHLGVMKVLPPVVRDGVRVFRLTKRD
jgi:hypothetical protein